VKILDPGHIFDLHILDAPPNKSFLLHFVKRQGEKYPGNKNSFPGTTSQEVIRALIARQKYVDQQIHFPHNDTIIRALRSALITLEARAAEAAGIIAWIGDVSVSIEDWPICERCGHLQAWCDGSRHG
jgi:hypothetical protein